MLEYPTVSKQVSREIVYIFQKIDGSNIRAEWDKKKGFWKFGRRHGLLDASTPILQKAPELIKTKYEQSVSEALKKARVQKAVLFFEFFGEYSFAGNHDVNDTHDVMLIDASLDMKELMSPRDFCKIFPFAAIDLLLGHELFSADLEQAVRDSTYFHGNFSEGVVCKSNAVRFKCKTNAWLERLRTFCAGDERKYGELE